MLKFFFWILLAANAALFAYDRGYLEAVFPSGREPGRMRDQLNADKIRLVPANAVPPAQSEAASAPPATAAASAPVVIDKAAEVTKVSADAARKPPEALACAEIGNFNADDAKRFSAQLAPLNLGARLTQHPVLETSHMVYIPSQGDKDGADKKAGELKRLGVNDFFIIQDNSPLRWGISLGVFKSEESARQHLANLNQKGVRTARLGQRSSASGAVLFRIKELNPDAKAALEKLKTGFPKQEVKSCAAA